MKLDDAPLIGEKLIAESKNVYVIGRAIGRGGYGIVYECCDLSNRKFALKVGKRRSISLEIKVLKLGDGFFHFVKLIDEGLLPDDGQQFFVMELLWKNLSELQRLMPTKRFSLSTAIRCSLQTINGIEELHSIGYISRDLKPSNFIVRKPSENNNLIYLIDFGIARKYIDHNGALKPRRLVGAWRGTARYCSLANHFKQDQCRRDDVECWFYMTIEFINGKLPWSEISKYERDEIAKKKQSLRKSEREAILGECPDGWSDILDIIDSCGFEAAPEYDTVSSFHKCLFERTTAMRLCLLSNLRVSHSAFIQRYFCTHRLKQIKGGDLKLSPQLDVDPSLIRNIGIIAHIDAGKTTVTERLLYLAGATSTMGDVDSGNTVTDYMDLERERGITIQSAAISLFWRQHRINLIDTPGHVDFTLEVERCARVLDGAVTVLDGSAGVQAQTITVWRQANKFNLPSVFFVNKMDKRGASFEKTIDSIKRRLSMHNVVPVSMPTFDDGGRFIGSIDLINRKYIDVEEGDDAEWTAITQSSHRFDELMAGREEMLSQLADADEHFAECLLSDSKQHDASAFDAEVANAMRRATLARNIVPVACGTALRCAGSVKPILDMVTSYLPAPYERNHMVSAVFGEDLSAIVFKIGHDKRRGQLSFVRVYTGEIKNGSSIYNANRGTMESRINTFIAHSDILQPVDVITAGNIGVLTGLQSTVTGDTLLTSESAAKSAGVRRHRIMKSQKDRKLDTHNAHAHDLFSPQVPDEYDMSEVGKSVLLAGIDAPDPVYFCSAEPPSAGALHSFERALNELTIEDPSLRVTTDGEFGQTIIEGMGELHIEVVKDRLKRDYGLNVFMGPLQVAYREVITTAAVYTATVEDVLGDRKHGCTITIEVAPSKNTKFKTVLVKLDEDSTLPYIRAEWLKAINEGCASALHNGPLLGYPVDGVAVTLRNLVASGGKLSPAIICACAGKCLTGALKKADAHLLEPILRVEVTLVDAAAKTGVNAILREISKRRGTIVNVEGDGERAEMVRVCARMPLAELTGIASTIRIISSGLGDLHMQLEGYDRVSEQAQAFIKSRMTSDRR